jgi:hypothetical protein
MRSGGKLNEVGRKKLGREEKIRSRGKLNEVGRKK